MTDPTPSATDPATPRPRISATAVDAITCRGLWARYGSTMALSDVGLRIPAGALCGLLGRNGAGKTTLMRVLAGLHPPFHGTVLVQGKDVETEREQVVGTIGWVPDAFGVHPGFTVQDYLRFFAATQRLPSRTAEGTISDMLSLVDLTHKRHALVDQLSRGMQQRLAVARALLHDPQVLLMDEPAEGLDPQARSDFRALLAELHRLGRTMLISSHVLRDLAGLCTHLAVLVSGKHLLAGRADELFVQAGLHRTIAVEGPGITGHAAALAGLDGITLSGQERDRLEVTVSDDDALDRLHAALVAAGARLTRFQPLDQDWESAFVALSSRAEATVAEAAKKSEPAAWPVGPWRPGATSPTTKPPVVRRVGQRWR